MDASGASDKYLTGVSLSVVEIESLSSASTSMMSESETRAGMLESIRLEGEGEEGCCEGGTLEALEAEVEVQLSAEGVHGHRAQGLQRAFEVERSPGFPLRGLRSG